MNPTKPWQLEFVRLVGFPAEFPDLQQNWWKDTTGEEPEDFLSTRKRDSREDKGSYKGSLLSLTVAFSQIIWEARPLDAIDETGNFPTFKEPFEKKLNWFIKLVRGWLTNSCPSLFRLAFSAKFLRPAADIEEVYRDLQAHLPIIDLTSAPNDFLLQINRRARSKTGLPINRISTWSKLNVAIQVELGVPFVWSGRCYSALELDINTAPELGRTLSQAKVPMLFKELVSLGRKIAEKGDQP